jgi:hypothetical protein
MARAYTEALDNRHVCQEALNTTHSNLFLATGQGQQASVEAPYLLNFPIIINPDPSTQVPLWMTRTWEPFYGFKDPNAPAVKQWQPFNSFKDFNKLPAELRNAIWAFLLPEKRLIRVVNRPYDFPCQKRFPVRAFAKVEDNPLLRVCRESRGLMSSYYLRSFERQLILPIRVNLARDIISFSSTCSLLAFVSGSQADDLKDLKNLGL